MYINLMGLNIDNELIENNKDFIVTAQDITISQLYSGIYSRKLYYLL